MNNLELYDKFRKVPETAKKNISDWQRTHARQEI